MLITILTAYPLSLSEALPGRGFFKWFLIFAMIFSGGLIPSYLGVPQLGLAG